MERMTVLAVEPGKRPYVKEVDNSLEGLQKEVDGTIEAIYPFDDPVALICNEEGKLRGLALNRGLRDEDGVLYDVIAGTFLGVGLSRESFAPLSRDLQEKYLWRFYGPEMFIQADGTHYAIASFEPPCEKNVIS